MTDAPTLSDRIRALRAEQPGLTYAQLAAVVGSSRQLAYSACKRMAPIERGAPRLVRCPACSAVYQRRDARPVAP